MGDFLTYLRIVKCPNFWDTTQHSPAIVNREITAGEYDGHTAWKIRDA